ncbi:MAG: AraC family transcriptional regulator [Azonexus sp.]|nr:AraC family transcriptional regulator [Azonexus sp.]
MLPTPSFFTVARDALADYALFKTADPDEAKTRVASVYCPHELVVIDQKNCRVDTAMSRIALGGITLNRLCYGPAVTIDAGRLSSFLLVMMPFIGSAQVTCGAEQVRTHSRMGAVISPTLPLRQTINANCDQIMVQIDDDLLNRICAQHLGHELNRPLHFNLGIGMNPAGNSAWPALVNWLLAMLDSPTRPGLDLPLLRTSLEHMVVATLLHSQPNNYSSELQQPAPPIAPCHVKRVEDYIRTHAREPLTIADLAAHAGVSVSALYTGFRDFRNTSPMAYLRNERLQFVHDELLHASPETHTVADIASYWGFSHLSRFAAHYKRKFGESPSDTLRKRWDKGFAPGGKKLGSQ